MPLQFITGTHQGCLIIHLHDQSGVLLQDSSSKDAVAAQLHQACGDVGFFYIRNHGKYSYLSGFE